MEYRRGVRPCLRLGAHRSSPGKTERNLLHNLNNRVLDDEYRILISRWCWYRTLSPRPPADLAWRTTARYTKNLHDKKYTGSLNPADASGSQDIPCHESTSAGPRLRSNYQWTNPLLKPIYLADTPNYSTEDACATEYRAPHEKFLES